MRRGAGVGTKETKVLRMGSNRSLKLFCPLGSFKRELLEHC